MASAATGDAQRDEALPSADWFDNAAHPQAVFTATSFRKVGEGRFVARGTLDLKGRAQPAELPFRLTVTGTRAEAQGRLTLDRTAFGIGAGPFAATDQIPAQVKVNVRVRARAAAPS
jgi:polyisoprenoid-binding protein YceI